MGRLYASTMAAKETFLIRQLVDLTGLSEFTLRGWENRYKAFSPDRTESGRRVYSKQDVERALLLRELVSRGHRIGDIVPLSNQKLQNLFDQDKAVESSESHGVDPAEVDQVLNLVALQKWEELRTFIAKVSFTKTEDLIHQFLIPVMQKAGAQVSEGIVSISQEHILSAAIKEKIYATLTSLNTKKRKKSVSSKSRFILAGPEGDHHEIALLMAHLLLHLHGFTSLYLGPHTPVKDLSETALRFDCTHIVIASTLSKKLGAQEGILSYLQKLRANIGPKIKILVGGQETFGAMNGTGSLFQQVSSFTEFELYLKALKKKERTK